ncbi:MAG: large conductance mechanosensitive channel protein MscL [Clostridia bacterium]|nr:large conductance mechanosensitive channel protein MscL [Clostridia bacterium]
MWKEFKKFALKGNVLDMAIGVIVGGAFGAIVTSLVNDVFMPLIGLIFKTGDLNEKYILLKASETYTENMTATQAVEAGASIMSYGKLIGVIINFILIAIILFFVVKGINKLIELGKKEEEAAKPARKCPFCKSEIADDAVRCPHCTSELPLEE